MWRPHFSKRTIISLKKTKTIFIVTDFFLSFPSQTQYSFPGDIGVIFVLLVPSRTILYFSFNIKFYYRLDSYFAYNFQSLRISLIKIQN